MRYKSKFSFPYDIFNRECFIKCSLKKKSRIWDFLTGKLFGEVISVLSLLQGRKKEINKSRKFRIAPEILNLKWNRRRCKPCDNVQQQLISIDEGNESPESMHSNFDNPDCVSRVLLSYSLFLIKCECIN